MLAKRHTEIESGNPRAENEPPGLSPIEIPSHLYTYFRHTMKVVVALAVGVGLSFAVLKGGELYENSEFRDSLWSSAWGVLLWNYIQIALVYVTPIIPILVEHKWKSVLAVLAAPTIFRLFFRQYIWHCGLNDFKPEDGDRRAGQVLPPYPNAWWRVAFSHEVKKGQVIYRQTLGEHLAIYRGEDGKVSVLDAYCPHLGANLGVLGKVVKNNLECPFHGWQFSHDGECAHIPYSDKIPSTARTKSHRVFEANGNIAIWKHDQDWEPHWEPPVLTGGKGWYLHGESKHVIRCHVSEIPENGADTAHLNVLHLPFLVKWLGFIFTHTWKATWEPAKGEDEKHLAWITVDHKLGIFGWQLPLGMVRANIRQNGPGMVFLRFILPIGEVYVCETVTPVAPLLTEVGHLVFGSRFIPRFVAKLVITPLVAQFERDIWVWNNKTFQHKPMLVREDGPIAAYRRWYRQFYTLPLQVQSEEHAAKEATSSVDKEASQCLAQKQELEW